MAMGIVGSICLVAAIVLFFIYRYQSAKLFSMLSAEAVTIAGLKETVTTIADSIGAGNCREYVKVRGMIRCETPMLSELKQEPCVHYQMQVTREYEETVTRTDSDGETHRETERKSETVSSNKRSITFQLQDDTGTIDVNPNDANIETIQVLNEFRPGQAQGGMISFGNFSIALGGSLGDRRTLGYRYQESILPVDRQAFIVAIASDGSGKLMLQKPIQGNQKFLISLKDEETLLQATKAAVRYLQWGMIGSGVLGVLLILIGLR